MKSLNLGLLALTMITLAACQESSPTNPGPQPSPTTMTFKQGARYEYQSYHTDAQSGARTDSTARQRTWTLVSTNATLSGRSNVAVYVDSVFTTLGGVVNLVDTVYLSQSTNNDVYRYASLAPELDLGGLAEVDLGKEWRHEAKLNATTASWLVGESKKAIEADLGIPLVNEFEVRVSDSAVASAVDSITVGNTRYATTKTTHRLRISVYAIVDVFGQRVPLEVATESLMRTSWMAPALGAVVREEREGKVISADYKGQGFTIPVPGYVSIMTKVIAAGG